MCIENSVSGSFNAKRSVRFDLGAFFTFEKVASARLDRFRENQYDALREPKA